MNGHEFPILKDDDASIEMPPPLESLQVNRLANEIIDQLGDDRSTDTRTMHDAQWESTEGQRYKLIRLLQKEGTAYYLDAYRPLGGRPWARYGFFAAEPGARMFDPSRDERLSIKGIDPNQAEDDLISHLLTAGVSSPEKASSYYEDAMFWDRVCYEAGARSYVIVASRNEVAAASDSAAVDFSETIKTIDLLYPGLPRAMAHRAINYALQTPWPGDHRQLPPA